MSLQFRNLNNQYANVNDEKFNVTGASNVSVKSYLQVPSVPDSTGPVVPYLSAGDIAFNVAGDKIMYSDGHNWKNIGNGTLFQVNTGAGLVGGPITSTGTVDLANTGVVAGPYTNSGITVDQYGHITTAVDNATTVLTDGVSVIGDGSALNTIRLPNRLAAQTVNGIGSISYTAEGIITALSATTAASALLTNVYNLGTIQVPGHVFTPLTYTNTVDPTGLLVPSNPGGQWVLGTGAWTAPVSGWYLIRGSCSLANPREGEMQLLINKYVGVNAQVLSGGGNFSQGGGGVINNVQPGNLSGDLRSIGTNYKMSVSAIEYFTSGEIANLTVFFENTAAQTYTVSNIRASSFFISA